MNKILGGALAAIAIAALAATARADNVCQWTGHDWACGDSKGGFTQHYGLTQGPQMLITPVPTVVPTGTPAHRYDGMRPY